MRRAAEDGWFDADSEAVGVRGDVQPLSWGETLPAYDTDGDLSYNAEVTFATADLSAPIVFKFKVDGTDNPNDGWENGRNRVVNPDSTRVVSVSFDEEHPSLPPTLSDNVVVHQSFAPEASALRARDLFVYLPPGYETGETRYPVLYMHDGRNIFDASEVGVEWRMDEHANELIASGEIEPVIIVGVDNTPERIYEYTPSAGEYDPSGGGDVYGQLLVDHIKPFIEANYRTLAGPEHTALGGSSLGGLISLYLGLEYPDIFGQLLVVSPSIWWDDHVILRKVEALDAATGQRIWLDMGGREGGTSVDDARNLNAALLGKGWADGDVRYVEAPEADHSERAWSARSADMLRFLFGRMKDEG